MPERPNPLRVFAGLGCRRGCSVAALSDLLDQTLQAHGLSHDNLLGLASIELKSEEPGLHALAAQLGIPLLFFSAAQLATFESRLTHRSLPAFAHSGCYGVAESAALALAEHYGSMPAQLLVPRHASLNATLALACGASFDG